MHSSFLEETREFSNGFLCSTGDGKEGKKKGSIISEKRDL